tara:strand:- start:339 stop:557 length:219 start_codon:yes stop_codon:yes gene_type:complete
VEELVVIGLIILLVLILNSKVDLVDLVVAVDHRKVKDFNLLLMVQEILLLQAHLKDRQGVRVDMVVEEVEEY